jgi:hypothetical protein
MYNEIALLGHHSEKTIPVVIIDIFKVCRYTLTTIGDERLKWLSKRKKNILKRITQI